MYMKFLIFIPVSNVFVHGQIDFTFTALLPHFPAPINRRNNSSRQEDERMRTEEHL